MSATPSQAPRHRLSLGAGGMTSVVAGAVGVLLLLAGLVVTPDNDNGLTTPLPLIGYLLLVLVAWTVVAGVRREPGSWLSRRAVRRAVVAAIAVDCVGVVATSSPGLQLGSATLALLFLLVLLNIALGTATQRIATAPEGWIDERQEALRNRAHRGSYPVFAAAIGVVLVADAVSAPSREWVEHVFSSGGLFVLLELLFVLPAMVLAFVEPAPPPPDPDAAAPPRPVNARARVAVGLVVLVFAIPLLASIALLVLPPRTSALLSTGTTPAPVIGSSPGSGPAGAEQTVPSWCADPTTTVTVGWGVTAQISATAYACWDGHRAFEPPATSYSDCWENQAFVTVAASQCGPSTAAGPDGSLVFTWRGTVAPALLPSSTAA